MSTRALRLVLLLLAAAGCQWQQAAGQQRFQFCGGTQLIHAMIKVCSRSLPDDLAPPAAPQPPATDAPTTAELTTTVGYPDSSELELLLDLMYAASQLGSSDDMGDTARPGEAADNGGYSNTEDDWIPLLAKSSEADDILADRYPGLAPVDQQYSDAAMEPAAASASVLLDRSSVIRRLDSLRRALLADRPLGQSSSSRDQPGLAVRGRQRQRRSVQRAKQVARKCCRSCSYQDIQSLCW